MEKNKYPNANTSPERLVEIQRNHEVASIAEWPGNADDYVRDLLAMLQERAWLTENYICHCQLSGELYVMPCQGSGPCEVCDQEVDPITIEKVKKALDFLNKEREKTWQQLHDQRWRRLDEMPVEFPIQMKFENDPPIHVYSKEGMPRLPETGWWWRPIPPLPKE